VQPTGALNPDTGGEPRFDRIGPFRILRGLATSGAGDVFLAAGDDRRRVVLKVLAAPGRDAGAVDDRIASEVAAYARLSHPNLVRVVDVISSDGFFAVALEDGEGTTLNVVRAALTRDGSKIDDACSLYVGACIFAGLAAAHGAVDANGRPASVLHRNVNPSNVLVAPDGAVKIGNFGVASVAEAVTDSNPGLTWGSYGYFAPEQAQAQAVGPHTDVYSAMLVLWELLAGRKAIERGGDSAIDLLDRMAAPSLPSLDELRPDVDARVRAAIRAGLQPALARRGIGAARAHEILASVTDLDLARERFAEALAPIRAECWPDTVERRDPPPPPAPARRAPPPPPPVRAAEEVETSRRAETESAPAIDPTSHSAPVPGDGPRLTTGKRIALLGAAAAALFGAGLVLPMLVQAGPQTAARRPVPQEIARPSSSGSPTVQLASESATAASTQSPEEPVTPPPGPASAEAAAPPVEATAEEEPPIPPDVGELQLPPAAAGHRIFVDGRTVSEGVAPVRVRCGPHEVRIGSAGRLQQVDVPCGASLALTR
jgi:serine/threonine-protein kinase